MDWWLVALLTIVTLVVVKLLILLALAGGSVSRLTLAIRAFYRMLPDAALADKVQTLMGVEAKPAGPPKPSGAPLRLLTLLQRGDGRFLDFVLENVEQAGDEQIVAAVR